MNRRQMEMLADQLSGSHMQNALEQHMYISTDHVICYDEVLCYLSNIIGQGSFDEIQENLKRFFTSEQIHQAHQHLQSALDYTLTTIDSNDQSSVYNLLRQCRLDLNQSTNLLIIMETISTNKLFSYLPIFVTHDWIHMIRSIQNIEQFDTGSTSMSNLHQQMCHLKEHMTSLDSIIKNFNTISTTNNQLSMSPLTNDQCCLRTYCTHNTIIQQSTIALESPCSSWSSLDIDTHPITPMRGFIRNPVTNFLVPIGRTEDDMESSILSLEGNLSGSEHLVQQEEEFQISSKLLTRSLSFQPSRKKRVGPTLIKRADVLWMYPAGVIKQKQDALVSSIDESTDEYGFGQVFKRTNSCDIECRDKIVSEPVSIKTSKKTRRATYKHNKGSNLRGNRLYFMIVAFC